MIDTAKRGEVPPEYDITWSFHNNVGYAISHAEIKKNAHDKMSQIVISNIQAFPKFEKISEVNLRFIYLHRLAGSDELRDFFFEIYADKKSIDARMKGIETVFRDFVQHAGKFSHVLLNTSTPDDLHEQAFNILQLYQ